MAKQLLRENFFTDWKEPEKITKLQLNESTNLMVESNGKQYKVLEGFEVPVWKLGKKNLNERIYSAKLGEKVVREFGSMVTANLADHPKEEGSVANILSVSKNPHIKEGILYVDAYVVDEEFEKKLNRMLEAGYGLGVSSSCYGDLDESTGNVLEEGFEVDRFFDWVLTPSYEVYVTKDSRKQIEIVESAKPLGYDANATNNNMEGNIVYKKEEIKENDVMTNKVSSLEEKNLKLGIKGLFEKAEKAVELKERLDAYNEILEYCEGVEFASEYVKDAQAKIEEVTKEIHALAEKGKLVEGLVAEKTSLEESELKAAKLADSAEEKASKLKEAYEKSLEMLDGFKVREKKLREMYEIAVAEKNGMVEAAEYKELAEKYDELEEKVDEVLTENTRLSRLVKRYKSRVMQLESEKEEDEDEEKEEKKESLNKKPVSRKMVEKDDEECDEDDEECDDKEDKKESFKVKRGYDMNTLKEDDEDDYDLTETSEIRSYVQELIEQNPANKRIKSQILKCKTLFEAQKTYLDLMDLVESNPSPYKPRLNEVTKTYGGVQVSKETPNINRLVREGWL